MSQHVRSIFLVRHGRTSYNAAHRLQGQVDIPLDEVGRWQVERTGETLRELYVERRPDVTNRIVVASDLCRASATAHAFADPLELDVHLDPRVRERSFGEWDGMAVDDLAERYPEDYRSWAEFRGGEMKYGAESKEAVGRRGVEAIHEWSALGDEHTDLFFFTHGAWISQTLQTLLGISAAFPDFASVLSMRNAHWVRLLPLDRSDGEVRWRLMEYNHGPAIADTPQWENPPIG